MVIFSIVRKFSFIIINHRIKLTS